MKAVVRMFTTDFLLFGIRTCDNHLVQFFLNKKWSNFLFKVIHIDRSYSPFFTEQMQELRKINLGGIICQNMDYIKAVQPDALLKIDPYL